ncbi:MAG: GGDEF domain-containing protein [Spirochaetes bacterium]|nr:GGDEF domain-containing protein [Spirochaetota bacterium]
MEKPIQFLNDDDEIFYKLKKTNPSIFKMIIKRFIIDFHYGLKVQFKDYRELFLDLFKLDPYMDFASLKYPESLKPLVFEINSFSVSFRKLIKGDFSVLSNIGKSNPKIYIILKLLYEINLDKLTSFISYYNSKSCKWTEYIYFLKEAYSSFLYIMQIPWETSERLKITNNFNSKSNSSEISSNILYALSIMTKFCRQNFELDPGISSHLFISMMDSIEYILKNIQIIFAPIICRLLGFSVTNIHKNRKNIDRALALLFDIDGKQLEEEIKKLFTKEEIESEEKIEEQEKIVFIPIEMKPSASLLNMILGVEFFQDQIKYPDYIGELMVLGFDFLAKYKVISPKDPMNYAIAYVTLFEEFLKAIDLKKIADSEFTEIIQKSLDKMDIILSELDYYYLKRLTDLRKIYESSEKPLENDYIKKSIDELNTFKKQFFFKSFFFVHFTDLKTTEVSIPSLYDIVSEVFQQIDDILVYFDRRKSTEKQIFTSKYELLDLSQTINIGSLFLKNRFEKVFPIVKNYDPKSLRNYLYILYNFLKLGIWSFISESSSFASYSSVDFLAYEPSMNNLNIIESPEYYLYNKLQVELEKFKTLAYLDPLTGCYNNNFLNQELKTIDVKGVLLYIDLDNFKYFNDNFSHDFGNIVLKEFGTILLKYCRKSDYPVRVGGDEFIVLLKSEIIETGIYFTRRIYEAMVSLNNYLHSLVEIQFHKPIEKEIQFSVGASFASGSIDEAIKVADRCMYISKQNGKNALTFIEDKKFKIIKLATSL